MPSPSSHVPPTCRGRPARTRGSSAALVAVVLMVAAPSAGRAPVAVPSPAHSSVPTCLVVDPSATLHYQVVVRDAGNNPIGSAAVALDFTAVSGVRLCRGSDPDLDRVVHGVTNATGVVDFAVRGGGITVSGTVQVRAEGAPIGAATARSPDLDGNLQIDSRDLERFGSLAAGSPAGDYDCDGDRDGADSLQIVQRRWHKCLAPLDAFGAIHSPTLADYAFYQLKLTYLGFQAGTVTPGLGARGSGRAFDLAAFGPYQRSSDYLNDYTVGDTLLLSNAELKGFLDRIATRPFLQDTTDAPLRTASLMVLRGVAAAERCWEFIAPTPALADTVFRLLYDSASSPAVKQKIASYRDQMTEMCP